MVQIHINLRKKGFLKLGGVSEEHRGTDILLLDLETCCESRLVSQIGVLCVKGGINVFTEKLGKWARGDEQNAEQKRVVGCWIHRIRWVARILPAKTPTPRHR